MVSRSKPRFVFDVLKQKEIAPAELARLSGLPDSVVDAIVHQRYTPSPAQRVRIQKALGLEEERIIWGHTHAVDPAIHAPD